MINDFFNIFLTFDIISSRRIFLRSFTVFIFIMFIMYKLTFFSYIEEVIFLNFQRFSKPLKNLTKNYKKRKLATFLGSMFGFR
jgi:hypothetical protein